MSMVAIPIRLTGSKVKIYECVSQTNVVVGKQQFENTIQTTFKKELLDQSDTGDLIRVEVLSCQQTAQDPLTQLLTDINELSQELIFETDLNGNALEINNYIDLLHRWYIVKAKIRHKYAQTAAFEQFLVEYEKNLGLGKEALLEAMQHKGIYGILFSGIYACRTGLFFTSKRVIKQLFGKIDLPLLVRSKTTVIWENMEGKILIEGEGVLDEGAFDMQGFQQLFREMADSFNLKVNLTVSFLESYEVRQSDGWIAKAEQTLRATVSGHYRNETKHLLTLKSGQ